MNPMMRMQRRPKGDISKLWSMLGVDFAADQIVWQRVQPLSENPQLHQRQGVRLRRPRLPAPRMPFNPTSRSPITSGLQQVLFPFPGFIDQATPRPN